MTTRKYVARLLTRVEKIPNGCWVWSGATHSSSRGNVKFLYGSCIRDGKRHGVHRFLFEHLRGPVPDGLVVDHLCRNTLCVNPGHLEAVTSRVNTLRGVGRAAVNARKTHCISGHRYTNENTLPQVRGGKVVGRECRECRLAIYRRYYRRNAERRRRQAREYRERNKEEIRSRRQKKRSRVRADGPEERSDGLEAVT